MAQTDGRQAGTNYFELDEDGPVRLAVIGTAGRKDDAAKLSAGHFEAMVSAGRDVVRRDGITHGISGGAAWADHVVVALGLAGDIEPKNITLFLPAAMDERTGRFHVADRNNRMDPGSVANWYHEKFSEKAGRDSIRDISDLGRRGAQLVTGTGFKARNSQIANSLGDGDTLMAFTFGSGPAWRPSSHAPNENAATAGLKEGGTADTWEKSSLARKIHVTLAAQLPGREADTALDTETHASGQTTRTPDGHRDVPRVPAPPRIIVRAGPTEPRLSSVATLEFDTVPDLRQSGAYIDNGLLSNTRVTPNPIPFRDVAYTSVEAAYVARKNPDQYVNGIPFYRHVSNWEKANPGKNPKRLGNRNSNLQPTADWDSRNLGVMLQATSHKFAPGTREAEWLLRQDPNDLVEWNNWNDRRWGVAIDRNGRASGANMLGETLKVIRHRLRIGSKPIPIDEKAEAVQHHWLLRHVMRTRGQDVAQVGSQTTTGTADRTSDRPAQPLAQSRHRSRGRDNGMD